ncbi:LEM domain-containing protein 1 isoform X2 [Eucyclogobius newberryi]|uniref:LEM domain-containing protein 1 isoform X2 n=1 Tax=Eucyclogobius newberryi TaxID=166745 RepID=UPI003B58F5C1
MPVFVEETAQLSKARLKSDLIAHNVALPPAKSKKGTYVELHKRHVQQKTCADFSSDEEPEADDEEPNVAKILDPRSLTDDDLKAALQQHGVKAGPIVASTRALYERKLRNLLLSNGLDKVNDKVNGAGEAVLYSDSEEEEVSEEEQEQPVTEEVQTQTEAAERSQQDHKQDLSSQSEDHVYPQCFLVSSRLRFCDSEKRQLIPKRNPRNVLKSSRLSRSCGSQVPTGISRASSVDQPSGLAPALSSEHQSVLSNGSVISAQNFSITEMVEEESQTLFFNFHNHFFTDVIFYFFFSFFTSLIISLLCIFTWNDRWRVGLGARLLQSFLQSLTRASCKAIGHGPAGLWSRYHSKTSIIHMTYSFTLRWLTLMTAIERH